jgi:Rrf2 family transcriptional regulator, repressor of oqxAB
MRSGISHTPGWFPVAVQALLVLARTEESCSSSAMAQDLKAHAVFLRRVLAELVRANLIQAREGRDGGYRLARSAEHITLAEIYQAVNIVDPTERTGSNNGVNAQVQTILDEIRDEAEQRLLEILARSTLASVLERVATADRSS